MPEALATPGVDAALDAGALGTAEATGYDRRAALVCAVLLGFVFIAAAPFASRPLLALPGFIPAYDAAVALLDIITAMLLWSQYRDTGDRSFLALTCGFAFTPIPIAAHALSFPDAIVPGQFIGESQSTAWLWMAWHAMFPLFVIVYAVLARGDRQEDAEADHRAGALALILTVAASALLTSIVLAVDDKLPPLMNGSAYRSAATTWVLATGWTVHLIGLALVVRTTRLKRLLDLWIAVVLLASLVDLGLSALLVTGRFQLGFYLGRACGLLASVFVLGLLLRQAMGWQARAVRSAAASAASESRLRLVLDGIGDAFYALDRDWRFLFASRAALALWGKRSEDVIGRTLLEVFPEAVGSDAYEAQHRVMASSKHEHIETLSPILNRWIEADISRTPDGGLSVALRDISARKQAELELRQSERKAQLLLAELQHRVRNTLAVVRSIARRTAENSDNVDDMVGHFQGRLDAFSRVQAALTRNADATVDLALLIEDELIAHATREGAQVQIEGPPVALEPKTAERLSLAIHELTTNAVKHGALVNERGHLRISWQTRRGASGDELLLAWRESGVEVQEPASGRDGFGMELLLRSLPYDLEAETRVEFKPHGLEFEMVMPLRYPKAA